MASATASASKVRRDPFFRTEITIIVLQVILSLALLVVVWLGFTYLKQNLSDAFVAKIVEAVQSGGTPLTAESANEMLQSLQDVQARSFLAIVAAIILTTALFGYALARFALIPTRNTLLYQKQFIGNIAHELRTPLSIIKTTTEVALLDDDVAPKTKKVYESTVEELNRISNIIDNLLSLSVFTRPERIEFTVVDLGEVVDTVIEKLAPLIERKRHMVTVAKSSFQNVWGNATALEQLTMNLVKNALNYTPAGGHIRVTITCTSEDKPVLLSIKDSGVGIEEKDLHHIFEPFYRAEASRNRATGSSGLGLTIVSELVKLHKGKISIKSSPDRGTTVTILFPNGKKSRVGGNGHPHKGDKKPGEIAIDFSA